jgi:glutaminase
MCVRGLTGWIAPRGAYVPEVPRGWLPRDTDEVGPRRAAVGGRDAIGGDLPDSEPLPPPEETLLPSAIDDDRLRSAADHAIARGRDEAPDGEVADYIPALAGVDPTCFGLVVSGVAGDEEHALGDADVVFPIQSISKVFSLVLAMQKADAADGVASELWQRVGREPSGDPFNSLVQLEHEHGKPRNPMVNPGALVVHDVLLDHCDDPKASLQELVSDLVGEEVGVDDEVYDSERGGGHRNVSMANLMASFGNLTSTVDEVMDSYVHACALSLTTRQLARATRFLANDGVDPITGRQVLSDVLARRVNSIMLTCGTYDAAGEFAFKVGLPCKSGVAGGIMAVVPDRMGIAVWSPPLDPSGNSLGGRVALHHLAEDLGLSIF